MNEQEQGSSPSSPPKSAPRPRRGCFFYGCLGSLVLCLVVLFAAYLGFRYALRRFTDDHPLALPRTQMSATELRQLEVRVGSFGRALDDGKAAAPLTLTSDEANALIQTDSNWSFLKDRLYVAFESNHLRAQVSFPADELIGSPRFRGRYLNAAGELSIAFRNGALEVHVEALSAHGRPLGEYLMRHIRTRNFALSVTNADAAGVFGKLNDVRIENEKLVIVPKPAR